MLVLFEKRTLRLVCTILLIFTFLVNGRIITHAQEEENRDSDAVLDLNEYGPASEVGRQPIDPGVVEIPFAPGYDSNTATQAEAAPPETIDSTTSAPNQLFMPLVIGAEQEETGQAVMAAEANLGAGAAATSAAGVYGDFNNDGFDDLAIGVPSEDFPGVTGLVSDAGAVNVIYGSSAGLSTAVKPDQFWREGNAGLTVDEEPNDRFGSTLVIGDFNGDQYEDLAIGAPLEDVRFFDLATNATVNIVDGGMVTVIYGSQAGLHRSAQLAVQYWSKESAGIDGFARAGERFGSALTTGDFNRDGFADLAIGAPGADLGTISDAGAISVIYGSVQGLHASRQRTDQVFSQQGAVAGEAEAGDQFGLVLTSGDFNGDTYGDLAIGVPYEDINPTTQANAGAVNVIYGSSSGLNSQLTTPAQVIWYKGNASLGGVAWNNDLFGWALAAGDFNGDGRADLAVSVPYDDVLPEDDDVGTILDTGSVYVIYATATGLTGIGYQTLDQRNSIPTDDSVDIGDQFGYALTAGNFNRTRLAFAAEPYADLAVGVPGEDIGAISNAGTVSIFYGSSTGLRDAPREVLSQNTGDVPDQPDAGDRFGAALAVGNYNGEFGPDDELTIGVPDEDTTASQVNVGAVNVLFCSATGLNGTNSQLWYQGFKGVNDTAESYDSFGQVAQ